MWVSLLEFSRASNQTSMTILIKGIYIVFSVFNVKEIKKREKRKKNQWADDNLKVQRFLKVIFF